MTKIEWTEATWNPIVGCSRISDGCQHCYAERMATRLAGNKKTAWYQPTIKHGHWTGEIGVAPFHIWQTPLQKKHPTIFFVGSMGDLFHENIAFELLDQVFDIMEECPHHIFQILTKRNERMLVYLQNRYPTYKIPSHIWRGVTVENMASLDRLKELWVHGGGIRFVSIEPMLEPITLGRWNLNWLDWVICGAETGPNARPCHLEWVTNLREQCIERNVPFFFKKFANKNRTIEGRLWEQMPKR